MKIAIVILNWNGKKLLEQFLPTIVKYSSLDFVSIYVADNASTDDSINYIKTNYKEVNIIQNDKNGGFAKGYNDALQHIDADIYALVNNDIEVSENWLNPVIQLFKSEKNTAVIQPKILDFKNKTYFEYAGAGGGFIDNYGYPFCRGRIFESVEEDQHQFDDTSNIFWASGACFFIRSNVYHQLNGFDEDYFAHQEEIDLCWRVQNLGYDVKYVGQSKVYHVGGATLNETNPHKTFLNFRNSLFSLVKNLPKNKGLQIVIIRLLLDGIAGVKFLFNFKPKHTFAILKAHLSFYNQLSNMLNKRGINKQKKGYYKTKNIVWKYFILGRKKFENLK